MILCGWCRAETLADRCVACGRDPALPWLQRAQVPPVVNQAERNRLLLAAATATLRADGLEPTIERLADQLGVDPRTVRRWRSDVRPTS